MTVRTDSSSSITRTCGPWSVTVLLDVVTVKPQARYCRNASDFAFDRKEDPI